MLYEPIFQSNASIIDTCEEKFYSTLMQGNKLYYKFSDSAYFGLHYAYLNSFNVVDLNTKKTFIINKGEFFLSKRATNYAVHSVENLYTSIITLLIERSYPYNIEYNNINQHTALQDFLRDNNIHYIITKLANIPKKDKETIEGTFELFSNNVTAPYLTNQIFLESMSRQVLLYIDKYCIGNKLNESHLMIAMKKYIMENLATANLSNAAEHLNYTSSYLSDYVKKETGQTFTDFITNIRMNKAVELLDKETISLSEISKITGYSKTSSFIRVFKNKYNMTPTEYRNNPMILN